MHRSRLPSPGRRPKRRSAARARYSRPSFRNSLFPDSSFAHYSLSPLVERLKGRFSQSSPPPPLCFPACTSSFLLPLLFQCHAPVRHERQRIFARPASSSSSSSSRARGPCTESFSSERLARAPLLVARARAHASPSCSRATQLGASSCAIELAVERDASAQLCGSLARTRARPVCAFFLDRENSGSRSASARRWASERQAAVQEVSEPGSLDGCL